MKTTVGSRSSEFTVSQTFDWFVDDNFIAGCLKTQRIEQRVGGEHKIIVRKATKTSDKKNQIICYYMCLLWTNEKIFIIVYILHQSNYLKNVTGILITPAITGVTTGVNVTPWLMGSKENYYEIAKCRKNVSV